MTDVIYAMGVPSFVTVNLPLRIATSEHFREAEMNLINRRWEPSFPKMGHAEAKTFLETYS